MEIGIFSAGFSTWLSERAFALSKQARAIEEALDSMNPLSAGKKKGEALFMLKKWLLQMENFAGQLKKYKVTVSGLLDENRILDGVNFSKPIIDLRGYWRYNRTVSSSVSFLEKKQ